MDPGKNNGWAVFDTKKNPPLTTFGTEVGNKALYSLLTELEMDEQFDGIQYCIVEDYINRPPKAGGFDHTWDKGYTHRVIGAINFWCFENNVEMVLRQPMLKPAAYGQLGATYQKGKRNMHHMDAIVHGYSWLLDNNYVQKKDVLLSLKGKT